tara:strand:+ start:529 stop:690 length:162 start_codon:yes stop_codon:yes gene_type:complete
MPANANPTAVSGDGAPAQHQQAPGKKEKSKWEKRMDRRENEEVAQLAYLAKTH